MRRHSRSSTSSPPHTTRQEGGLAVPPPASMATAPSTTTPRRTRFWLRDPLDRTSECPDPKDLPFIGSGSEMTMETRPPIDPDLTLDRRSISSSTIFFLLSERFARMQYALAALAGTGNLDPQTSWRLQRGSR